LLLVLDNCEHLLDACAVLVHALLSACPRLQVLATSREPLSIDGEVVWRVPSLQVPEPTAATEAVAVNPSVQLFVERATAVQSRFVLNERNAAAVAQICRRLDGIPLAVELAAARSDVLTAERLAERLDRRFQLLTGGSRMALPRQQTLSATLDWSYDLLSRAERVLFERLTVFSGGWRLEAAEQVCSGPGLDSDNVFDVLARLARKSLVVRDDAADGSERYSLLETVREYGRQKLVRRGVAELSRLRSRHAEFYTSFAEQHDPWAHAATPMVRVQREVSAAQIALTAPEDDNFRAALGWWLEAGRVADGLRLATARWEQWRSRGLYTEARSWLEPLLELAERGGGQSAEVPPGLLVEALRAAAFFEAIVGDRRAWSRIESSIALARSLDDPITLAGVLAFRGGLLQIAGKRDAAQTSLEESRALLDGNGENSMHAHGIVAMSMRNLGMVARWQQDYDGAAELFRSAISAARS
jgi:non-specific serine/threonine protein kinase